MAKINCWEFKNCGRQPGGAKVEELGVCPASTNQNLNGAHHGTNGGRSCWVVAGTLCKGETQGTFAQKYKNCEICDFYAQVKDDEYPHFMLAASLLAKAG